LTLDLILDERLSATATAMALSGLFALLLYSPASAWVAASRWRALALVVVVQFGLALLLAHHPLPPLTASLLLAVGLTLILSPVILRMLRPHNTAADPPPLPSTRGRTVLDTSFFKGHDEAAQPGATEADLKLTTAVFENCRDGIVITTGGTNPIIVRVNHAFTAITGYSAGDVLGHSPRLLESMRHDEAFYRDMRRQLLDHGAWHGEMLSRHKSGEVFPVRLGITAVKDSARQTTHYVALITDISDLRLARDRLEQVVNHDPLTGLPNRRLLNELLEHAIQRGIRQRSRVAVLFIDLDRFKVINDTLGHQTGDALLALVSRRLGQLIRKSDLLARLGGDEFIIVMDGFDSVEDVAQVAQKIIQATATAFQVDDRDLFVGATIGISLYPDDGQDAAELVKAADIAMYQAKQHSPGGYCYYSRTLSTRRIERFALENELRQALARDQLTLYYQPQVSLPDGRIVGAEALIRWHHPELGLISPGRFIPLAEETGLILPIGEWVLREAASQTRRWAQSGYGLKSVSLNVSGVQIQRSNFSDTVYGVLVETGCDPCSLELEITESTAMHNTSHVNDILGNLKSLGVRLAIDDLGTGYSSLSRLRRMPLDKLKIDQSFIRELPRNKQDAAIARTILALGASMELEVIAEGVEKRAQATLLADMGCRFAQGYHFGRPMPATEFERLLTSS
jgi:diguanylate cyclase (GGDEF)-like protein/PAS domain S-box-containing protein